jgi:hypothetical protein
MQYHIPKEQNYQKESALQDITLTLLNVLQDVTTGKVWTNSVT